MATNGVPRLVDGGIPWEGIAIWHFRVLGSRRRKASAAAFGFYHGCWVRIMTRLYEAQQATPMMPPALPTIRGFLHIRRFRSREFAARP